jgi:hypothetical protein
METIQLLSDILLGVMIFYLGTVEKRLSNMQAKLDKAVNRAEVNKIVELEIKTVVNEQANLKEDLGLSLIHI